MVLVSAKSTSLKSIELNILFLSNQFFTSSTYRRRWQSAVSEGFLDGTDVVSPAATPRSPIEITRNQIHMFAKHHSTNREDELFPRTKIFGKDIAIM